VRPPRLATLVVSALVAEPHREYLLGDLDEQFSLWQTRGRAIAWRRYWQSALKSAWQMRAVGRGTVFTRHEQKRGIEPMKNLFNDLKIGLRTAAHSPGYSVITIVTLALAIGANALLFSIANPLLVRALPLKDPDTLGWIQMDNPKRGIERGRVSQAEFAEWRDASKAFSTLAAYDQPEGTLSGHGQDAERVTLMRATTSLTDVWGLKTFAGRPLQAGDDDPGRPGVGVLAHHFWRERFAGDPNVIGRTVLMNGKPMTIVGIMSPDIELGSMALLDIWTPLIVDRTLPRDQRTLRGIGRLAPGATLETANAEIATMFSAQTAAHPAANTDFKPTVVSTRAAIAGSNTWVILALLGVVVVFVLLIACANLANLVLARVTARRQELAVRLALGASRLQLIRPLMLESLVLSISGGALGLALAHAGLRAINAVAFEAFFRQVAIDTNVVIFTAVMAAVTPLVFSLWPAMSAGRAATVDTLKDSRGSGGKVATRKRNILVGAQVALAMSLLVTSSLIVQSMFNVRRLELGLDTKSLLTFRFELPGDRYVGGAAQTQFAEKLIADLKAEPGVTHAAVLSHVPIFDGDSIRQLSGTKNDGAREEDRPWASWFAVSADYFGGSGVRLLAGRGIEATDREGTQPVAVISKLAADKYFGGVNDALGRTVTISGRGAPERRAEIVGIATDTRDSQLISTSPQIYVPFAQWPEDSISVLVTSADPSARVAAVRAIMRRTDPAIAVANVKPLHVIVDEEMSSSKILNAMFAGFALLALVLAAAGLYGVISYSVGQRRREIGVRMALGAAPSTIQGMVLGEGLRVTVIGLVVGLVMAVGLGRASASLLEGIGPNDLRTFTLVTVAVIVVAIGALWVPAVRAMRLDPARTLRDS
jgi:putative ABC transport system permease protein